MLGNDECSDDDIHDSPTRCDERHEVNDDNISSETRWKERIRARYGLVSKSCDARHEVNDYNLSLETGWNWRGKIRALFGLVPTHCDERKEVNDDSLSSQIQWRAKIRARYGLVPKSDDGRQEVYENNLSSEGFWIARIRALFGLAPKSCNERQEVSDDDLSLETGWIARIRARFGLVSTRRDEHQEVKDDDDDDDDDHLCDKTSQVSVTSSIGRISNNFWHPHKINECSDEELQNIDWINSIRAYQNLYGRCDECQEVNKDPLRNDCTICNKEWHRDCIPNSPDEIDHAFHAYHTLKLLIDGPPNYSNRNCDVCQQELRSFLYHCSICDFSMHVKCSKNPPPLIVDALRCHMHTLILMGRDDTFTCNACGTHGERCPYVCPPCALMFHRSCITLPHVININRHDHRISHTYFLDFGDRKCPICHQKIDWRYGAYSCLTCPNYAVHSKCATRDDVWDGIELEGVPEELVDVSPFKVIEEGIINHFSHDEHNLRIVEDAIDRGESVRCKACVHPIYYEKHYHCMECNFLLHETCANLPLQKRHWLCTKPLFLNAQKNRKKNVGCDACGLLTNGIRYDFDKISLDVRCASTSLYCDYECHPHTLFLTTLDEGTCGGCNQSKMHVLRCVECDFSLCFACATLPKKTKHKCDDHFLSLRFGEKARGKYWCEICETLLDPQKWFYTCDDCGVNCHIQCLFGDFLNCEPGVIIFVDDKKNVELVSNDRIVRPKCASCGSRCLPPLMIMYYLDDTVGGYCCSLKCLKCLKVYCSLHSYISGVLDFSFFFTYFSFFFGFSLQLRMQVLYAS